MKGVKSFAASALLVLLVVVSAQIADAQRVEKRNAQGFTEAEVAYNDAVARHGAGDLDGAITLYTRALELDPYYTDARSNRGQARLDKGDTQGAIADFSEVVLYRAQNPASYYNRGNAYLSAGKYTEAIGDFTRSLELNPRDAQALNNRAYAYREFKRPQDAIADYTKAIEIAPRADYFYNRGVAYEEANLITQAHADYTQAIERNPEDAHARAARGTLLLRAGRNREADADFAVAFRLDSSLKDRLETYIKEVRVARGRKR